MATEQYAFQSTKAILPVTEPAYWEEFGAQITFEGIVRGLEDGRVIRGIDYTSYPPMLEAKTESLFETGRRKFGAHFVSIIHRVGFVPTAEPSVRITVARKNSAECFEICRWYLDSLKTELPIWKNPIFMGETTAGAAEDESTE